MLSVDRAVNRHVFTADRVGVPFVSMAAKSDRKVSPLGERVLKALDEEGRSQTAAEAAMVDRGILSKGQLSSLISGRRGTKSINVEMLGAIADFLHVEFDWLARDKGPMKKGGKAASPVDEAVIFARRNGCREDAIDAALERNKDRIGQMTATELVFAFDEEARTLDRAKVPRPEVRRVERDRIARTKKQLERVRADSEALPASRPAKRKGVA